MANKSRRGIVSNKTYAIHISNVKTFFNGMLQEKRKLKLYLQSCVERPVVHKVCVVVSVK